MNRAHRQQPDNVDGEAHQTVPTLSLGNRPGQHTNASPSQLLTQSFCSVIASASQQQAAQATALEPVLMEVSTDTRPAIPSSDSQLLGNKMDANKEEQVEPTAFPADNTVSISSHAPLSSRSGPVCTERSPFAWNHEVHMDHEASMTGEERFNDSNTQCNGPHSNLQQAWESGSAPYGSGPSQHIFHDDIGSLTSMHVQRQQEQEQQQTSSRDPRDSDDPLMTASVESVPSMSSLQSIAPMECDTAGAPNAVFGLQTHTGSDGAGESNDGSSSRHDHGRRLIPLTSYSTIINSDTSCSAEGNQTPLRVRASTREGIPVFHNVGREDASTALQWMRLRQHSMPDQTPAQLDVGEKSTEKESGTEPSIMNGGDARKQAPLLQEEHTHNVSTTQDQYGHKQSRFQMDAAPPLSGVAAAASAAAAIAESDTLSPVSAIYSKTVHAPGNRFAATKDDVDDAIIECFQVSSKSTAMLPRRQQPRSPPPESSSPGQRLQDEQGQQRPFQQPIQMHGSYSQSSSLSQSASTRSSTSQQQPKHATQYNERWAERYDELAEYRRRHGHCIVNSSESVTLFHWIKRQRSQYKQKVNGRPSAMTDERQHKLEQLDFVWDSHDEAWEVRFRQLVEYKQRHGHTNVPVVCKDNPKLGIWVKGQRKHYWSDMRKGSLSQVRSSRRKRYERLEAIGFQWKVRSLRLEVPGLPDAELSEAG